MYCMDASKRPELHQVQPAKLDRVSQPQGAMQILKASCYVTGPKFVWQHCQRQLGHTYVNIEFSYPLVDGERPGQLIGAVSQPIS